MPQAPDSARHRRCRAGNSRCRQPAGSCQAWLPDPCRHPGCPVPPRPRSAAAPRGLGGFGESQAGRRGVKETGTGQSLLCSAPCHASVPRGSVQGGLLGEQSGDFGDRLTDVPQCQPLLRADTSQRHPALPQAAERTPSTLGQPPGHRGSVPSTPAPSLCSPPRPWRALPLAPLSRRVGWEPGAAARALLLETQPEGFPKSRCLLPGGAASPSPLPTLNFGAAGGRAHPQLLTRR